MHRWIHGAIGIALVTLPPSPAVFSLGLIERIQRGTGRPTWRGLRFIRVEEGEASDSSSATSPRCSGHGVGSRCLYNCTHECILCCTHHAVEGFQSAYSAWIHFGSFMALVTTQTDCLQSLLYFAHNGICFGGSSGDGVRSKAGRWCGRWGPAAGATGALASLLRPRCRHPHTHALAGAIFDRRRVCCRQICGCWTVPSAPPPWRPTSR